MKILKIIVGLCLLIISSFGQVTDDDFLLMVLPSIIATSNNDTGLEKVELLHGRWEFSFARDLFEAIDYFRFDKATARTSTGPSLYLINGEGSISPFFEWTWCGGGLIGSNSTDINEYLVLCNWGFPDRDLGSAYFFKNIASSFPLVHYWYTPSTGVIQSVPYNGNGQWISSSYSQTETIAVSNSVLEDQAIADLKKTRYEEFHKLITSQADSAKVLSESSNLSDAQAQIKAVSNLLIQNRNQ